GFTVIRIPIIEFGDVALAQGLGEIFVRPRPLRDSDRQDRFTLFANLRTLGDVAQPVKIHVGPAGDGHEGLAAELVFGHIFLDARHADRTGWFSDGAGIFEYVFDPRADLVVADGDHIVHGLAQDAEGFFANLRHCDTIGEDADGGK